MYSLSLFSLPSGEPELRVEQAAVLCLSGVRVCSWPMVEEFKISSVDFSTV